MYTRSEIVLRNTMSISDPFKLIFGNDTPYKKELLGLK